jgi:SAM-dependent methyltransferase
MKEYLQQLQHLYGLTAAAAAPAAVSAESTAPKILDARPQQQYLHQRLSQSVNVQLPSLTSKCYLLPDKSQPFAAIVPSSSTYTVTQDPSQNGTQQRNGSTAVYLKGTSSLQEFLTSRGWAAASFLQDCPELWKAAAQLKLLEQHPTDVQQLSRRCLFAPLQLLEAEVETIAAALAALRVREQQQQAQGPSSLLDSSCCTGNGSGSDMQQTGAGPAHVCLTALDNGCGSGRDVAWLASRQHRVNISSSSDDVQASEDCHGEKREQQQQQQQQQAVHVTWHVTGVDEWLGALERAADLAAAMQLTAGQVQLVLGRICPQSGDMQLQRLPAKSKLNRAQHVSVLHAGCTEGAALVSATSEEDPHEAANPAAAAASASTAGSGLTARQYDLILCVRFLERALLPQLRRLLRPGGFILYCTFVDGPGLRAFGRPSGHDHVLQPGELAGLFGPAQGFAVVRDDVVLSADGRELSWFVAQRT